MPAGVYHQLTAGGRVAGIERFSCARGPAGWRYVSRLSTPDGRATGSADVTLDASGHQLRVVLVGSGWSVRGGRSGPDVIWVRRPDPELASAGPDAAEHRQQAAGFIGGCPALLVGVAALAGDTAVRLRLVVLSELLGARSRDEQWQRTRVRGHRGEAGVATVTSYRRILLDTGEGSDIHIAGDIVLAAPGLVLTELDSPPGSSLAQAE